MREREYAMADEMALTKSMRVEKAMCPLCQTRLSMHFLRYRHRCKKQPVDDADERRERALQLAIQALRVRMAAP
jgi:hypothetical protein